MPSFESRRREFLDYSAAHVSGGHTGFFSQVSRLALGRDRLDEGSIREALAHVDARIDCSDFAIAGLLRILYLLRGGAAADLLSADLVRAIEETVLGFKYWWDEPGDDPMCYWTENHQILFHADEYLAGQLFPQRTFRNAGSDGRARMAHALPRLRRWFDLRLRLGFSEWLSNCYFDEDLIALLNLYDFAADAEIRGAARACIEILLFEMALHTHRGVFGATHGRTYAAMILGGREEPTASTSRLALGQGIYNDPSSLSAVAIATGTYRPPAILEKIAAHPGAIVARERHGIEVEEAARFGLDFDELEDGVVFWGMGNFLHPKVFPLSMRMVQEYRIYQYGEFKQLVASRPDLAGGAPSGGLKLVDKWAMTEVNVETMRTADWMLSCAQSFRPGLPGYQQHVWQATLDLDAVVFTNHPGAADLTSRPSYWAGNGRLPRAAQHRNVLVCLHRVPAADRFPFSHGYFPRAALDEVAEVGNWTCGRRGDGYVALWSRRPVRRASDVELVADAPENAWVCELGDRQRWGDFAAFVRAVGASRIGGDGLAVAYASPSAGEIELSWEGPFRVAGDEVALRGYPRFENPFASAAFGDAAVRIEREGEVLEVRASR